MQYWVKDVEQFSKLVIYGAGNYGNKAFDGLKKYGYESKVECFCVSEYIEKEQLMGIPVYLFENLDITDDTLVIVALGSVSFDGVIKKLKENGIKNWIDGRAIFCEKFDISSAQRSANEIKVKEYLKREEFFNGKNSIKASHVTYAYVRNAGDTFLSHCIRKYLDFEYYNIIPVSEKVTREVIDSINNTDVLIIGGGGLFLPDTNKNELSGWQWAVPKELLDEIKVPIIIYSVGYNFYRGQKPNEIFLNSVNELVKKASFVGLRNIGSVESIKEIVDEKFHEKIVFQPCITTITSDFEDIKESNGKGIVGLNMGCDRLNFRFKNESDKIRAFENVAKAIMVIENKGYKIKYYSHTDVDEEYVDFLKSQNVNFESVNLSSALPDEVKSAYEEVDVAIGMRGHSQMIPFGMGRRIITLASHDKMKWFLQDVGLMECYVDLDAIDDIEKNIVDVFDSLMASSSTERLQKARRKLYEISEINKSEIMKIANAYKRGISI